MSRKKSGVETLCETLIKQHGIDTAIYVAKNQRLSLKWHNARKEVWIAVHNILINQRATMRGY